MAGEEEVVPSIADSIGAAVEQVETGAPAERAPQELDTKPPIEGKAVDKKVTDRETTGRFAKRTADAPAHIAAPQPVAGAPAATALGTTEVDAAPNSWKDEVKAEWGKLPPTVRQEIQRRERDITTGLQRAAESRKFGDSVYQEVAPYMEILRAEGATPQAAIKTLLETAYILRHGNPEHKRAMMLSLIQQYGINFNTAIDPERARVERELDLRRQNDMRGNSDRQVQVEREAVSEVEAFAQQPGHEHMEAVRPYMVALLNAGQAKGLQDAYDQAVWANPTTRAAVQAQGNLQKHQELDRNRRAASSVTGNLGSTAVSAISDPKNLRGTLEEAFGGSRI